MPYINTAERHGIEKGLQQGRQEGRQEANRNTARNLIENTGLNDATIAQATGLAESEVVELRREAKH
ncbi:hypothetical protein [Pistricoccus aurantiacus]|uniref:hypothetical protein n=1 Tax=Pistricoccus aurantiacus TaxID=1883414 RepID=UPI003645A5B9